MKSNEIKNILENISHLEDVKTSHIMSKISYEEVLLLSDDSNSLRIKTLSNDMVSLNGNEWSKTTNNDTEGFATYSSTIDINVKLFIDETKVEVI
jgi:hypothetical protein